MVGTTLGHYLLLDKLGEGGMGEVYRARDTRLDRDVAIKVLPDAVAADLERLTRFEREAKTLALLNHPHIAQIYGIEPVPGGSGAALVMELVDGEDLSARIARGPVPVAEALPIALADRRCARSGPRARHHPPRPQASQHQDQRRRRGEGARLRPGQGGRGQPFGRRSGELSDHGGDGHRRGSRAGHCGLHGARAGARPGRGPEGRRLGLRGRAVRDAVGQAGVFGRHDFGRARIGAEERPGLGPAAEGSAGGRPSAAAPLPGSGSTHSPA
jgi:hypothetical protein